MITYKPHYACFDCRKTFKRRLLGDTDSNRKTPIAAKCPECGQLMADMGLDFKSPAKDDTKAWQYLRSLYAVGITYHSCGCSGPGYIPATPDALVAYLEERLAGYISQLRFWLNYIQPIGKSNLEKDKKLNWHNRSRLPREFADKKGAVYSLAAVEYWKAEIHNLEHNLSKAQVQVSIR